MNFDNEIDSDFLVMAELTNEVSSIVQNTIDQRRDELSAEEIEHIVKMTSVVISKLRKQTVRLTV